jgi:uncharacterized protein
MSRDTLERTARRIAEHVDEFEPPEVEVVLHGGEPLLAGHEVLSGLLRRLTRELAGKTGLRLGIQTNGVLLDEPFLELFERWDVHVGVSLDGNRADHDRHRYDGRGRGSHDATARGLELLLSRPAHRRLFSGLLCVIDVQTDPERCYRQLADLQPPAIDFLLPHGNWSHPPPHREASSLATPYADWLTAVFEAWYADEMRGPGVRIFEEIMGLVLGAAVRSETVGLSASQTVVIETNGDIEQVDALKSAYDGAAGLGMNVHTHSLADALGHPMITARRTGLDALSDTCRSCPLHLSCGGGYFPHRYSEVNGFRNPSVYCRDLAKLITHIAERLRADLSGPESPASIVIPDSHA